MPKLPRTRRRAVAVAGTLLMNAIVWFGALVCIGPLLWALVASFSLQVGSEYAPSAGGYHPPAIDNYLFVIRSDALWTGLKNTGIQEFIVLSTTLFFCPLAGYGFAKFRFRGRRILLGLTVLTLFFVPITQYVPLLLEMSELGWVGTYQALLLPLLISSLGGSAGRLAPRGARGRLRQLLDLVAHRAAGDQAVGSVTGLRHLRDGL